MSAKNPERARGWRARGSLALGCGILAVLLAARWVRGAEVTEAKVILCEDGAPKLPILAGSVGAPAEELKRYLKVISGTDFQSKPAKAGDDGIFVGLVKDFPWVAFAKTEDLGSEGFILKSDGKSVYLVANGPLGVQHAVTTFLHTLGCRWFFPGKEWEVIPKTNTVRGAWNERQSPSFAIQRRFGYGFGAYPKNAQDKLEWDRHNRLGGPIEVSISHAGHGLDTQKDFERNPDLFAMVGGKRVAGSKPCYSHPEYIKIAVENVLKKAAAGEKMVSMSPADGLGYCECPRCREWAKGGEVYLDKGSQFAKRPDGVLVNITSESLFNAVNEAARAVAEKFPGTLIGCYAYSAYSHPPSFKLQPNVFIQTTTAYRRTPMSLEEQLDAFSKMGVQSGIRGYYSVYQWDWDYPAVAKDEMSFPRLVRDLRFFRSKNVQSINAESSCNWGPRGLSYYVVAQLMWDVNADPKALIAEFYEKAFGPAAEPMERYYVRWLGSYVAVRAKPAASPKVPGGDASAGGPEKAKDELSADYAAPEGFGAESLKAACRDLDESARRVKEQPEFLARVNHLRLYAHYLYLRIKLEEAAKSKNKDRIQEAVRNETVFGARIMNTNMVHARPLIGKEFDRRFRGYQEYLRGMPEGEGDKGWGKGFRVPREDVPTHEEIEKLWAEDLAALGLK